MTTTPMLAFARRHAKQPLAEALVEARGLYRLRRLRAPRSVVIHEKDAESVAATGNALRGLTVTLTAHHPGTFLLGDGDA